MAVNVSQIDIYDPEIENRFLKALKDFNLTPKDLMIEITESVYSEDKVGLSNIVENMRKHGFKIEMDDFGSGYSSLNVMTTIPIDVIKLDMKFIHNMLKDEKCFRLVELVFDIAKFLNVPVVAEGVEEEEQLFLLKKMGCEFVQGFYFSKPVPPEQFEKFIVDELKIQSMQNI